MTIQEIYALPVDEYGWRVLPSGNRVTLGDWVKLGDGVKLGDDGLTYIQPPLQIQGSRHLLYVVGPEIIGVGCQRHNNGGMKTIGELAGSRIIPPHK